jgi:hypothetical protein
MKVKLFWVIFLSKVREITCFQWLFHLPALAQVSTDLPGLSHVRIGLTAQAQVS